MSAPLDAPSLLAVLQAAHCDRADLALDAFSESQIRWAVANGLGPILGRAVACDPNGPGSPYWPLLQATDLTAQVLAGEQLEATVQIIDACRGRVPPLTLLKGISICEEYYPSPHLRPMRDIDLLVTEAVVPDIEAILLGLGYHSSPEEPMEFYRQHHHTAPLVHPRTGIWVEVHRRLSPSRHWPSASDAFCPEYVSSNIRPSTFRGRPVNRLSDELQVPYIASHWALSSKLIRGVGAMIAMLDLIYLLKRSPQLRWDEILTHLDGSAAAAHLDLLLGYLDRYELIDIPTDVMRQLARQQRCFGRGGRAILHAIIDRYVVEGRAYSALLTARNIEIAWKTLLRPGWPLGNFARVPWNLLWYRLSARRAPAGHTERQRG
jgi:Uncharacterised nucleotidyltransferase